MHMDDKLYHGPMHGGPHFHSGPPGKRGVPGVSPKVDVSEVDEEGAYTITVSDAYHTETIRVPVADKDFIAERIDLWLDAHPEATTTVQDGAITIEKLTSEAVDELKAIADGSIGVEKLSSEAVEELTTIEDGSLGVNKLSEEVVDYIDKKPESQLMPVSYHLASLSNESILGNYYGEKSLQCWEYNSTLDRFVLGYSDIDNTQNGLLVELDSQFEVLRRVELPGAGHFNDIAYNPNVERYYIATYKNDGEILTISSETLSSLSIFTVAIDSPLRQISYNETLYVTDSSYNVYKVNSDFETVVLVGTQSYDEDTKTNRDNVTIKYQQGSCFYNDNFVSAYWLGGSTNSRKRIAIHGASNFDSVIYYEYQGATPDDEVEGILSKDEMLYTISYYGTTLNIDCIAPLGRGSQTCAETPLDVYSYTSTNDYFDILHDNANLFNLYHYYLNLNTSHSFFGARSGVLLGLKTSDIDGWQEFISSDCHAKRDMTGGTWGEWKNISGVKSTVLTYNGKSFNFRKTGDLIVVNAPNDMPALESGEHTVGQLPDGYKPFYEQVRFGVANDTTLKFLTITADGTVKVYNPTTTTSASNFSISGCYIAYA